MEAKAIQKSGTIVPAKVKSWLASLADLINPNEALTGAAEITQNEANVFVRTTNGTILSINIMNIGGLES